MMEDGRVDVEDSQMEEGVEFGRMEAWSTREV